jgi:hypothetical protein
MSGCVTWKLGFSAAKIAEKLGTSRGAVLGRLHRLSGATLTYPSYIRQEKEARARAAARTKERTRVESTVIPRLQQEIARGVGRDRAIAKARKAGATLRAIGDAVVQPLIPLGRPETPRLPCGALVRKWHWAGKPACPRGGVLEGKRTRDTRGGLPPAHPPRSIPLLPPHPR